MVKGNKGGRPFKETPGLTEVIKQAEKAKGEGNEEELKKLKKQLKKQHTVCGAVMGNDKVCMRKPISDNGRCQIHGGNSKGQTTEEGRKKAMANLSNKNSLIHGAYSKNFKDNLTKEEVGFYNATIDWFFENFETDTDPINLTLLDRFIINFLKQARKDSVDFLSETQSYNDFEVKMIRFSESLGLNKKFKDSKENKDNTSQSDIALLLSNMNNNQ
ncbi:hypothetical protein J2Z83_002120 [Virgibacillus natechei]|uniref:Terminase small subunit n=1 Tax=Virgibacillus natechei TaxID=1216297 RepID=A0ABS4IGE0_9BACI|nr:HGGxSTG domain-containing protein [Virgibacillus natechei]MBP1970012.1 hypothetical protein [Virgibacillus natechei]UZD13331.1 hypothetical protein OLD84_01845 [Virgibacillus natechei]